LRKIPADLAEATESQSGKGYRHDIVVAVYNDRAIIVTQNVGGVGSLDEKFCGALLDGRTFIRVDNVRGKLDSQTIESFITTEADAPFTARAFRREGKVKGGHNIIQLSSNNSEGTRDIANRVCIIRIRRRPNDYPWMRFPEGRILDHIRANHEVFLGAVQTVVAEWVRQGKPRSAEVRHSFKEWVATLDWIMANIFRRPGMMDGHEEIQNRAATPLLSALRELAVNLDKNGELAAPCDLSATQIVEMAIECDIDLGLKGRDTAPAARVLGGKLGSLFKREGVPARSNLFKDDALVISVDEYEIVRWIDKNPDNEYREDKHYRFRKRS
jgi:hypothetical protein